MINLQAHAYFSIIHNSQGIETAKMLPLDERVRKWGISIQ
jgi:hypothetical protein